MKNPIKEMLRKRTEKAQAKAGNEAWISLSNLYLDIQAGRVFLNRHAYCQLNDLVNIAYPPNDTDTMREWWWKEFSRLPNWLNV